MCEPQTGLAHFFSKTNSTLPVQTLYYRAPEVLGVMATELQLQNI